MLAYDALDRLHQPPFGDRAVVLKGEEQVVGVCGFAPALLPFGQLPSFGGLDPAAAPVHNTLETGLFWAVATAHRGRGYAAEAARALVDYAFTGLKLERVVATTSFDNKPSVGVMRRLGMRVERNPYSEPRHLQVVGVLHNRLGRRSAPEEEVLG